MKRSEFLNEIISELQIEDAFEETTVLDDVDEWDSLARITAVALYFRNLNIEVKASDVLSCKTVADLLDLGAAQYE